MSDNPIMRILVADDSIEVQKYFEAILSTEYFEKTQKKLAENTSDNPHSLSLPDFQVDMVSQGEEALAKVKASLADNNPYALAFIDIHMPPGIDGIETIKNIWALDPTIQVVICTGFSDYTWEEAVRHLGKVESLMILKKPFDAFIIRQLAFTLTKKWELMRESQEYTENLEAGIIERTKKLQASLSIARGTLEASANGILVIDDQGMILDYNNKLIEMWDVTHLIAEKKSAHLLLEYISTQLENTEQFLRLINKLSSSAELIKVATWKTRDGRVFECYSQPYKLNEKVIGRIWSFQDITARAKLEEQLKHQATHDVLTGLPNRILLMDRIKSLINRGIRYGTTFGLIMIDLDNFKLVNDSLGHVVGDELLVASALRMQDSLREEDTCARLGGDEFVVVVSTTHSYDVGRVATKLLVDFAKPFRLLNHDVKVEVSLGISVFPVDGQEIDDLLNKADSAMYRAKSLGGNQFQYYTQEIGKLSLDKIEKEKELRQALLNDEFILVYQPQVEAQSEKIVAVEALIRWQHPRKGLILPLDFLHNAEEAGLIFPIGEWVLRTACQQNKLWQEAGFAPMRVAVNIANLQFQNPNLVQIVKATLNEVGLDPKYLELELSESVLSESHYLTDAMHELKELGVNIAVDHFGASYSTLNHQGDTSVGRLKIGRSFVQSINNNKGDEGIIQALITMANALNLPVVAEGVETKEQLDFLKLTNCNEIQGYYFSKPMSAEDLENELKKNS
ncbi:MAG: EAL domain-containing protein [Gammaproteobacteria bacterium]|nr:EAL domain-containing protein [Gammaproteobacteria bacterium]